MASKLGLGILGVANIINRLRPAFAQAPSIELRAIASRSLDRAQEAARACSIPKAHASYQALLDDPAIDAVYIPLPNTMHGEWTKKAADAGKHVLCEKPLAPNADEAQEIVAFCKQRQICLMDGFMWPHHPRSARIRETIDAGTLGKVRHVAGTFTFLMNPLNPDNIRLKPELAGGGLLDVGCYPVFGIRWALAAEPVAVFAHADFQHGVDVFMHGLLWFADGATASFDCGFTAPQRQHFEIVGAEAVLSVDKMWIPPAQAEFRVCRDSAEPATTVIDNEDQMVHMLEDFAAAIRGEKPVWPDPREAIKTLRVLDALAQSARTGAVVEIK